MDAAIHIAKMMGPLLVVNAIGMFLFTKSYRATAEEFLNSRALIYLAGFMTMLIGLGIVNAWTPSFPIAVTIVGWMFTIGGAMRMLAPERSMKIGLDMLNEKPWLLSVSAAIQLMLGLALVHVGYMR